MNGKALYELYRKEPPARTHMSAHSVAYWQGYDGVPFKHVRTSIAWWAAKAGKDNRKQAEATENRKYFAPGKPGGRFGKDDYGSEANGAVSEAGKVIDDPADHCSTDGSPCLCEKCKAVKTIILRCTDCNTRLEKIMGTSIPYCPNCKPQHNHVFNLDGSHAVSVCWCSCVHERLNEEGICRSCGADKRGIGA